MPQVHEFADIFPKMKNGDLAELKESIREHGLQEAIVLTADGLILDGRNRYICCTSLGIEPHYRTYEGDDPLGYVIRANLHRRHLDESQRAMIAARLTTFGHGGDRSKSQICDLKQKDAAEKFNVGKRSVESAAKVVNKGEPELVEAVDAGKVPVSVAAKVIDFDPEQQKRVAWSSSPATEARKVKRENRVKEVAERGAAKAAELGSRQYSVIYADPPWRFEPYSRETGMDRAAENHYETMDFEAIAKLDVQAASADDCVLFLWATAPMLLEALDVMEAWGFGYKTHMVWDKEKIGTGYWVRNRHELLLIGTKGDIPAPMPGTQAASVFGAKAGRHSEKPAAFRHLIDQMFPGMSKLEMFARQQADGWDAWGNEAESAA